MPFQNESIQEFIIDKLTQENKYNPSILPRQSYGLGFFLNMLNLDVNIKEKAFIDTADLILESITKTIKEVNSNIVVQLNVQNVAFGGYIIIFTLD